MHFPFPFISIPVLFIVHSSSCMRVFVWKWRSTETDDLNWIGLGGEWRFVNKTCIHDWKYYAKTSAKTFKFSGNFVRCLTRQTMPKFQAYHRLAKWLQYHTMHFSIETQAPPENRKTSARESVWHTSSDNNKKQKMAENINWRTPRGNVRKKETFVMNKFRENDKFMRTFLCL